MYNFSQIKDKVTDTASKIADKSVVLAKATGEKAKIMGKITKLKAEIAMEKDASRKNFQAIGKHYYETNKQAPHPDVAQAVADVNLYQEKIAAKKTEVDALKKQLVEDFGASAEDLKADIEEVDESVDD